ncbi:hypothetical protein [Parafrankia sp. FMc2]|uniref:hypothetical protein n=1 Tax=Parafrankia sp. FMc2 TaxID=3233196 RepID=UPI0034D5726D
MTDEPTSELGAPHRMPQQNLGQLFARPERTADLGALARRRPVERPAAPAPRSW